MAIPEWQGKAERKRAEAAAKIPMEWRLPDEILDTISQNSTRSVIDVPRKCGLLTKQEISITEDSDATDLLELLASGALTSVAVTTAFCKRAAIAQQLTYCLTETFFDQGIERARQLDEYLAQSGQPVGPLHGLPISVKDSFNIKGISSTIGFVSFIDNPPATQNSALIDILLAAGAVLYVKTNIPQTMMTPDSHNNVFGRVLNPHKLSLTAGGSSGGEGALIAMRGAPLGIGTDIAGSIRIPALCCGTFGFKPTVGRIPYGGQCSGGRKGMVGFGPSAGPLTNSVRDAELLLRIVFNSNGADLDPSAMAVPWMAPDKKTRLTIGLMPEDPMAALHPSMQRTMAEAVKKLKAAGHTFVDIAEQLPSISKASKLAFRYFSMDPARTAFTHIARSGEPEVPSLTVSYPPKGSTPEPRLEELLDLNVERAQVSAKMWKVFVENKLDLILSPGYQSCSQPHDTYGEPSYTVLCNLIDVSTEISCPKVPTDRFNSTQLASFRSVKLTS